MRRILFLLVIMLIFVITGGISIKNVTADSEDVKPLNKPSDPPHSFLGVWTSSGYTLQPDAQNYTTPGHKVVLNTKAVKSGWGFMDANYRWYKSTDGGVNWSEVSDYDAGMTKNLHITPKEVGTTYYQQKAVWTGSWFNSTQVAWSQVAAVHVVPQDIYAKKIQLSHDDDYLYNTKNEIAPNSTLVREQVDPDNYTEDLVWSVDNSELASIDTETGELFANLLGKSGVVTVSATIDNPDGTTISASTKVIIGGGLADQVTESGKSARFTLLGRIGKLDLNSKEESEYTIKWFRQPVGTSQSIEVDASSNKASFIDVTDPKMKNSGDLYWAVINVRENGKDHSYTTNKAKLTVEPTDKPNIELNNEVKNESFDVDNIDTVLNQVSHNDKVVYENDIINKSDGGSLVNGEFVLPIRPGTGIDSVIIDGVKLDPKDYRYVAEYDDKSSALIIDNINCLPEQTRHIKISTTVGSITQNETLITQPQIVSNEEDHSYSKVGNILTLNYVTNILNKSIRDISYGSINAYSKEKIISRTLDTNMPNNVVEIKDQRRVKSPLKVFVSQISNFTNEKGILLPGSLRLYDNDKYVDIIENKSLVEASRQNEPVKSIGWSEKNGLLLYMHGSPVLEGKYSATLNWTFEDSV
ncbi:hypothetical protein M5C72_02295 [Companilactobacillus allii]|uniref:hypothetical protein n=1 Tax=Companilactobacillus allii TaxID=1847728 RepID=UPI000F7B1391|nr:hypothetical protein [Companilactobacillus allii]USQ69087.1 hypothetical protein M5C72_02295 [Companilactobacillus allii]